MTLRANKTARAYTRTLRTTARDSIRGVETVAPRTIRSKFPDGTASTVGLDGECPRRSSSGSAGDGSSGKVGDVVLLPARNSTRGLAGVGGSLSFGGDTKWLNSQDPRLLEPGVTTPVTFEGGGFELGIVITYLLPEEFWVDPFEVETHPDVTLDNLVVVDDSTATGDVTVAANPVWSWDPITNEPDLGPVLFE